MQLLQAAVALFHLLNKKENYINEFEKLAPDARFSHHDTDEAIFHAYVSARY